MNNFAKTLLVSSLVAILTTGCGDDKDSQDTSTAEAGKLVFVDWGGTNTDARVKQNIIPFEKETGIKVTVVTPSVFSLLHPVAPNKAKTVTNENETIFKSCFFINITSSIKVKKLILTSILVF